MNMCHGGWVLVWMAMLGGVGWGQLAERPEIPTLEPPRGGVVEAVRERPLVQGAFGIELACVVFPDTQLPEAEGLLRRFTMFENGVSLEEYYRQYSQGVTWPVTRLLGREAWPQSVYVAPQPLGYYCIFDARRNPLGGEDYAEVERRVERLRAEALRHYARGVKSPAWRQAGVTARPLQYLVYAVTLKEREELRGLIKPYYDRHGQEHLFAPPHEPFAYYRPQVRWRDPLWPSSLPQQFEVHGVSTSAHELGHVLGAPDYYRGSEAYDGIKGDPCLAMMYGPTGPAFCRYVHYGWLGEEQYPHVLESGEYTLYRRNLNPAGERAVGLFVPSRHPHYTFQLEYVAGERRPWGVPGARGVLVNVLNTTLTTPFMGSPDQCYTYREGDPWFRAQRALRPDGVLFGAWYDRLRFDEDSEPGSRLPNLLASGVGFEVLEETEDYVRLKISVEQGEELTRAEYEESLIPRVQLAGVSEVLPHSFRAECVVSYRGEPMKDAYGFVYGESPQPTVRDGQFALFHRDRYAGRVLGLKPDTLYYVRAFVRNAVGVSYSEEEMQVRTLPSVAEVAEVPPLLEDAIGYGGMELKTTAQVGMMKLAHYYRVPLQASRAGRPRFDYARIHARPRKTRPEFRMDEFHALREEAWELVVDARLAEPDFVRGFDERFARLFGLPRGGEGEVVGVMPLTPSSVSQYAAAVAESLKRSRPVVVVRASASERSDQQFPLDWVIIDGVREGVGGREFHLVYGAVRDRDTEDVSGWYALDHVLHATHDARMVFGFPATVEW